LYEQYRGCDENAAGKRRGGQLISEYRHTQHCRKERLDCGDYGGSHRAKNR
jgi:hypothetical protein